MPDIGFHISDPDYLSSIICFLVQLLAAATLFFWNFERKDHFFLRIVAGAALFILASVFLPLWVANYIAGIRTFLVLILMQAFLCFCFRRSFWDVLFCCVGAFTLQNLANNVQVFFCGLAGIPFRMISPIMFVIFTLVYLAGYWLFARKIRNFSNAGDHSHILAAALLSLSAGWILQNWLIEEGLDLLPVCRPPYIVCSILTLYMQFGLLEKTRLKEENLALEQMMKDNEKQYDLSKETVEIINMKCHDLKHRILELENLGQADSTQLEEIREAVDIYEGLVKTGCKPLDIVLSEKNLLCEKYKIKFSCMIDGDKLERISPGDIAAIFGNALDNAIEYVNTLPEEKRIISLIGYARQDVMGIHIENYCEEALSFQDDLPVSTKGDDRYHGYGLKSIRYVVNKYGGNIVVGLEDNIFSLDIIFPVL